MSVELYYTAPPEDVFVEIKSAALTIWASYDDVTYVDEKVNRIVDITNVSDNWMYMVAMFDLPNQARLLRMVRSSTAALILEAMDN